MYNDQTLSQLRGRKAKAESLAPERLEKFRQEYDLINIEINQREALIMQTRVFATMVAEHGADDKARNFIKAMAAAERWRWRELTTAEQLSFETACPGWAEEGTNDGQNKQA